MNAGWISTIATVVVFVVFPLTRTGRNFFRRVRGMWRWLYGTPAIKGVREEIPSAPEMFLQIRAEQRATRQDVTKILGVLDELRLVTHDTNSVSRDTHKQVTVNGENTNRPGDLVARMARSSGAWLENPVDDTEESHDKPAPT